MQDKTPDNSDMLAVFDQIEAIRFYVNGRIDVRFSTPTAAAECFHFLRLYSLANH